MLNDPRNVRPGKLTAAKFEFLGSFLTKRANGSNVSADKGYGARSPLGGPSGDTTPCKVTPVVLHGVVSPVSSHSGRPTWVCIPSVNSLRLSYTGLNPQCKVTPVILHGVAFPETRCSVAFPTEGIRPEFCANGREVWEVGKT